MPLLQPNLHVRSELSIKTKCIHTTFEINLAKWVDQAYIQMNKQEFIDGAAVILVLTFSGEAGGLNLLAQTRKESG